MPYTPLPKSYKKMFPFKLSTTSYIYPDHILPNVAMLAPFLDEIELVLFESKGKDNYPDDAQIEGLMSFCLRQEIAYNIHLPMDIFLGDENDEVRTRGISVVKRVMQRTIRLDPSVYVLHFDLKNRNGREETDIEAWRRRLLRTVEEMTLLGVQLTRIAVETLGYPFEWIADIVDESGFSTCLDIGHILISGQDLGFYLDKYLSKTSIIHLHGFQKSRDHLGMDRLSESTLEMIFSRLREYHGIVSLEVFSIEDLKNSLFTLEKKWERRRS
jgi:sugar phosphate isomerase/epimerase